MRNLFGLCSLLLAAGILNAQSPATDSVLVLQQPTGQNCPVSLSASRVPNGGMAEVDSSARRHGQALHIAFRPTDPQGIAQADLILHGMHGSHIVPASTHADMDATETFSVAPSGGANHFFNSVVYLHKLSAVTWVELKSITFLDGSQWHTSAKSTCRVVPSSLQLVTSGY